MATNIKGYVLKEGEIFSVLLFSSDGGSKKWAPIDCHKKI